MRVCGKRTVLNCSSSVAFSSGTCCWPHLPPSPPSLLASIRNVPDQYYGVLRTQAGINICTISLPSPDVRLAGWLAGLSVFSLPPGSQGWKHGQGGRSRALDTWLAGVDPFLAALGSQTARMDGAARRANQWLQPARKACAQQQQQRQRRPLPSPPPPCRPFQRGDGEASSRDYTDLLGACFGGDEGGGWKP